MDSFKNWLLNEAADEPYHRADISKPHKKSSYPVDCNRCGGDGIYSRFHGTCFKCGGDGKMLEKQWTFPKDWSDQQIENHFIDRLDRNEKARLKKQSKKQEKLFKQGAEAVQYIKREGIYNSFNTMVDMDGFDPTSEYSPESRFEHPEENTWKDVKPKRNALNADVVHDIFLKIRNFGSLSDKQINYVHSIANRYKDSIVKDKEQEDFMATAPKIEAGKQDITGSVVSTKWQDSAYGSVQKMLVDLGNGNKLWGSVPKAITDVEKGDKVSFFADVSASNDDEHFGFYKRPTKAKIL